MTSMDKDIERNRYERYAATALEAGGVLPVLGAMGIEPELRRPYIRFEEIVGVLAKPGEGVLDLCCGDGQFSFVAAETGARVTGLDLSAPSLDLSAQRCPDGLRDRMRWQEGDCEKLPFTENSFEGVVCTGGLSYGEWALVLDEIRRVLRPGGWFVAVDSYNHNPIYRLNRWWHWLRGRRTATVNKRIPSRRWLKLARKQFSKMEVEYFGVFSFAAPVLRGLISRKRAMQLLEWLDACRFVPREWAFKIVVRGCL